MSHVPSIIFRRLFELSPTGTVITTPEGDVLDANQALLSLCGYTLEELRERNAGSLYADPQQHEQLLSRLYREGTVCNVEVGLLDKNGQRRTCLLTATGKRSREGELTHLLTIVQDITEYRRIQRELLEVSEQERRRIGRELHDGPASTLSGLNLVVRGLIDKLRRGESIDPNDLKHVAEIVGEKAEETRTLSHELHVPELENGTLFEALQTLQRSLEFLFGASCHLETDGPLPALPRDTALHLYRIAQEAAHNAGRHGNPENIWIHLRSNDRITLIVEDDGKGLPENVSLNQQGLQTIRYRAEVIGASCQIRSRPKEGTSISCHLPPERLE